MLLVISTLSTIKVGVHICVARWPVFIMFHNLCEIKSKFSRDIRTLIKLYPHYTQWQLGHRQHMDNWITWTA